MGAPPALGTRQPCGTFWRTEGGSSWTPSSDDECWGRDSCLRVASRFGHEKAVKELLESGLDVDEVRADNGATPLYLAALEGHEGVVEQLMKAGADVNKERTDTGTTPLWIAAKTRARGRGRAAPEGRDGRMSTRFQQPMGSLHFTLLHKKVTKASLSSS